MMEVHSGEVVSSEGLYTHRLRVPYLTFAAIAEHARREVLRDHPQRERLETIAVIALSVHATEVDEGVIEVPLWGACRLPNGPIYLYQLAYEVMPEQQDYYRQIKEVLRHEFRHALGDDNGEPMARVAVA